MKLLKYEKVVTSADDRGADMICTGLHGILNVLGSGLPVDPFQGSDRSDFARFCKQSVVYGGYVLIFTPN